MWQEWPIFAIPNDNPKNNETMKRITLALMCMASLALTMACGGGEKKGAAITDDPMSAEQAVAAAQEASAQMEGVAKCATTLEKAYGLKLAQIEPDFDFAEVTEGWDKFEGNGVNMAAAVYQKKDGSAISKEEFRAWAEKLFALTKSLSSEGKNIHGYDGLNHLTPEQANAEVTLDACLDSFTPMWAFKTGKGFQACYIFLQADKEPNYIRVSLAQGLSGNID